jgi:hypothetical protein
VAVRTMRAALRDLLEWASAAVLGAPVADDSTRAQAFHRLPSLGALAHLGVFVWSPSSTNPEALDGVADEWIVDTLRVELAVSVPRTAGQYEMLLRASDHETTIRNAVCSADNLLPHQPVWTGTTREISADKAWITSQINFRTRRLEEVRSL